MTTTVPVKGSVFRQRLTQAGLSERQLTRRTGLGPTSLRRILFRNEVSGAVALIDMQRCLDEVGMSWGDFLDPVVLPAANTADADVATLGALLNGAGRATSADRLCRALGWELGRLIHAADRLDERLRPLGQRLIRNANGYRIRPLDTTTDAALRRLNDLRDDEEGMHSGMARVLYQVYAGSMSKQETKNDHRVQVAALLHRSAIRASDASGERYVLTDDVRFALDF